MSLWKQFSRNSLSWCQRSKDTMLFWADHNLGMIIYSQFLKTQWFWRFQDRPDLVCQAYFPPQRLIIAKEIERTWPQMLPHLFHISDQKEPLQRRVCPRGVCQAGFSVRQDKVFYCSSLIFLQVLSVQSFMHGDCYNLTRLFVYD